MALCFDGLHICAASRMYKCYNLLNSPFLYENLVSDSFKSLGCGII